MGLFHRVSQCGKNRGFTLVEVLVVIAVLAIIAGAAIPIIVGQTGRGYKKEAIDQLDAARSAMMVYYQNNGSSFDNATWAKIGFTPGAAGPGQIQHFTWAAAPDTAAAGVFSITATCNTGTYNNSTVTIDNTGSIGGTFP